MFIVHWIKSLQRYLSIPLAKFSLVKRFLRSANSHSRCGTSMKPLRLELASKMGVKEVWEGLILGAEPSQTLCKRVGSKPAGFATPVVALLCTRRLHNWRGRAGETIFEGYRLFESAFHCNLQGYNYFLYFIESGNEATGLTVLTCQCIVCYFSFRHSPEQGLRPILPQSLRSRCLYQLSTRLDCNWIWQMNDVHF